nr:YncE family protein [Novosphingobium marinum]
MSSGTEVRRVESCANPHELASSPDGRHVALACYGGTSLDIFATDSLERIGRIELGSGARPHGIVWHDSGTLYATAEGRNSIFVVADPLGKAGLSEISTGQRGSHMLAVAPDESRAWTMDMGDGTVTLIDLAARRKIKSVAVGEEPEGIALSPDGRALWVSARGSDKAIELDPRTLEVRRETSTGAFPLRLAIRPQGDFGVTSNLEDGSLSVIDLAAGKVVRTIAVSGRAGAESAQQVTILFSDGGERIYVAETGTDTVAEVDFATGNVLRRLNAGKGGDGLAILDR